MSKKLSSVEKLKKTVQNSGKPVDKTVDKSHKSVEKTSKPVENSKTSVQNPVQNSVENSQKTTNSHDNSANKPSQAPQSTEVESNPTAEDSERTDGARNGCSERRKLHAVVPTAACTVDAVTSSTTNPQTSASKTTSSDPAIKVTNLHKSFRLPTERASGLKQAIFNWLKGVKGFTEHQVLRGVSLEVKKGEFVGIVGRNGSGKSTLLKLLAQIYYPEQGTIEVNGTLVPFIELGVGFNPELTGRENVYLNGALLGFSRKEMDAMYDEIVHFAELEPFMDAKLKNYSSGMQVRLAFSIAIRAKGDILILDEVLAVGDAEFQQKCNDYFASLHGEQTVILVTHSMENVRRFCDRAILIENGEVATEGDPDDVAKAYEALWG